MDNGKKHPAADLLAQVGGSELLSYDFELLQSCRERSQGGSRSPPGNQEQTWTAEAIGTLPPTPIREGIPSAGESTPVKDERTLQTEYIVIDEIGETPTEPVLPRTERSPGEGTSSRSSNRRGRGRKIPEPTVSSE